MRLNSEFGTGRLDKKSLLKTVRQELNANGFFNGSAQISEVSGTENTFQIDIREGKRTVINSVEILNAENDSSAISKISEPLTGKPFKSETVNSLRDQLLEYFERKGFAFAEIEFVSINFHNSETGIPAADLLIRLERNERSGIDSIAISGNEKTSSEVILRALRISPGESYTEEIVQKSVSQLNRLKFFKPVNPPEYFITSSGKAVLQINLQEINTNNFDGILGYVPSSEENAKGYFTGLINLSFRNLFGTGRGFWFKWEREDRNSQNLELHYLEPWLFSQPLNLNFDLFQRQQDTTYIQRKIGADLEFLATETIRAGISAETETVIPTLNNSTIVRVSNSRKLTTGINLTIDTRDDYYSPTSGVYFKNAYFYSSKKIGDNTAGGIQAGQNESLQRIELDLSGYYQFVPNQVAALSIFLRQVRGGIVELSDCYRIGGAKTVRGYRERQFTANRAIWSNLEYRFLLSPRTYVSLFYDSGYFILESDIVGITETISDYIYGYGLGITLETGMGILQVSYAVGRSDAINAGKIHFGILNDF